jgi:hypothetical protein
MSNIYTTTTYNNEESIDSINQREEINNTIVKKTEKSDLFFKKYTSLYNHYQKKYPFQDPLTKVLDEIDITNNLIKIAERENINDNLNRLNNDLKTLYIYSKILIKGMDSINIDGWINNNSYTIMDALTYKDFL